MPFAPRGRFFPCGTDKGKKEGRISVPPAPPLPPLHASPFPLYGTAGNPPSVCQNPIHRPPPSFPACPLKRATKPKRRQFQSIFFASQQMRSPPQFAATSSIYAIIIIFCSTILLPNHCAALVRCLNCRTLEDQLVCDDPCEGDLCAFWSFREMSTDHVVQGCLIGPDLRESGLRMGCRRNRMDALLCLCNSTDFCNENEAAVHAAHPGDQPMIPSEIRCQSRTSASFIRRQMVRPPGHSCHSDFCFFTQTNSTAIPADDPLGQPPQFESTTSRNCGPQLEFNFDILLGPVWPGNGLHSEACYQLETGRDRLTGCSCTNNDCNRHQPYPIDFSNGQPLVKCHLGPNIRQSNWTSRLERNSPPPFCHGHFCLVQRETYHGYGDHWTSGCLSANETAARARLKVGYRNILGVEQWLCASDWCNGPMLKANAGGGGGQRRRADGRTVDGPVAVGRGKTVEGKTEGGRVQARNQALANKRKEIVAFGEMAAANSARREGAKKWRQQLLFHFSFTTIPPLMLALFGFVPTLDIF